MAGRTVSPAGVLGGKLRQQPLAYHLQIVPNRSLQCPKYLHTLCLKLHQGTGADAADHDAIHRASTQGTQRLAHAVGMPEVGVLELLDPQGFAIHNHKPRGRTEVAIDLTLKPL